MPCYGNRLKAQLSGAIPIRWIRLQSRAEAKDWGLAPAVALMINWGYSFASARQHFHYRLYGPENTNFLPLLSTFFLDQF